MRAPYQLPPPPPPPPPPDDPPPPLPPGADDNDVVAKAPKLARELLKVRALKCELAGPEYHDGGVV